MSRTLDHLEFVMVPRDDDFCSTSIDSVVVLLDQMSSIFRLGRELISLRNRAVHINLAFHLGCSTSLSALGFGAYSLQMGSSRGRRRISINVDQVELLHLAGYTWTEIASRCIHGEQVDCMEATGGR